MFHSLIHSPKYLQLPALGQTKGRILELQLGFPHSWQGPKYMSHHLLPSQEPQQGAGSKME